MKKKKRKLRKRGRPFGSKNKPKAIKQPKLLKHQKRDFETVLIAVAVAIRALHFVAAELKGKK